MAVVYAARNVTLHHDDCRKVVGALPDASIDMVFADPPYGSDQNKGDLNARLRSRKGLAPAAIANDAPDEADALVRWLCAASYRVLKPGGVLCCCCHGSGSKESQQFARWTTYLAAVLDFEAAVVWDKGPMGLGWRHRRSYEFVLVASKPGAKVSWHDDSRRVENVIRPGDYGIRRLLGRWRKHPTEKPRALVEHFLRLHTAPGGLVLDPFAGAGSTLAAAVATGRRAIGVELDKRWISGAIERIEGASAEAQP
ncbi:MAG: DNA-methyltransferase [Lacipirellulaceae bacterium]